MNHLKYLTNRQYRVFSKKIKDVDVAIWEAEFKIAKSRQIREGVRQDRGRAAEGLNNVSEALKKETDKAKIEQMTTEQAQLAENVSRYEKQMQMIDEQINGIPANGENPGQAGILDTIASLMELKSMYQSYRKEI